MNISNPRAPINDKGKGKEIEKINLMKSVDETKGWLQEQMHKAIQ